MNNELLLEQQPNSTTNAELLPSASFAQNPMLPAVNRQQRVEIVNQIIKEIASRGRKFFHHEGKVAELVLRNSRIYYKAEYGKKEFLCLSNLPDYRQPKGWFHGGTLMGLCRDFMDYIQTGEKSNHNNGYGGLYSPHWGYSEPDMLAIQKKAKSLGYL
jgi:hypothetical protein